MMTTTDTPRVWIADLAAYNNGKLHGRWVDATDADEMYEQAKEIIASSPEPFAEEWAIHDYDNFPSSVVHELGEYPSFETVANVGRALEQHGAAFAAWLNIQDYGAYDADTDLSERFSEEYRGEWDSEEAYAMNYVEEVGWAGIEGHVLEQSQIFSYLDWEIIARELFQHGAYSYEQGYVFEDVNQ